MNILSYFSRKTLFFFFFFGGGGWGVGKGVGKGGTGGWMGSWGWGTDKKCLSWVLLMSKCPKI